jgi:membrane protein implicated in regulation of membrane protease activity
MLLLGAILLAIFVLPPPWGLVAVFTGGLIDVAESLVLLRWSRRRRTPIGADAYVGRKAVVVTPLRPLGQVRIAGELWAARSDSGADPGDEVIVRGVDELTLLVH